METPLVEQGSLRAGAGSDLGGDFYDAAALECMYGFDFYASRGITTIDIWN